MQKEEAMCSKMAKLIFCNFRKQNSEMQYEPSGQHLEYEEEFVEASEAPEKISVIDLTLEDEPLRPDSAQPVRKPNETWKSGPFRQRSFSDSSTPSRRKFADSSLDSTPARKRRAGTDFMAEFGAGSGVEKMPIFAKKCNLRIQSPRRWVFNRRSGGIADLGISTDDGSQSDLDSLPNFLLPQAQKLSVQILAEHSFFRPSRFSNVPPTIRFVAPGEKLEKPKRGIRKRLRWCHNSLIPRVMRKVLAVSFFEIVPGNF